MLNELGVQRCIWMVYGRVLPNGPLRNSDVPLYDSVVNSHAHGLSFSPTLVVVGALMLKRWISIKYQFAWTIGHKNNWFTDVAE